MLVRCNCGYLVLRQPLMQLIISYTSPPSQPKAKSSHLGNAVIGCASANRTGGVRTGPTSLVKCPTLQSE